MASLEDAITKLKSELASSQVEHASVADGLGAKFAAAEEERLQLRGEVEVIYHVVGMWKFPSLTQLFPGLQHVCWL